MRARIAIAAGLLALAACSRPAPTPPAQPAPKGDPVPVVVPPKPLVTPTPPDPKPKTETPPEDPNQPKPHSRFTFETEDDKNLGVGKADLQRRNAPVKDGAMHLNGVYPVGRDEATGSAATIRTPGLVYDGFTVAVRFKAAEFPPDRSRNNPILVAGRTYRWFILSRNETGNLVVELNQGRQAFEVKAAPLEVGKWTVAACSVDVPRRKVLVFVNGQKAHEAALPADFSWAVADSEARETDKVWMFANYSTEKAFKGSVGGFVFYDAALNADQMAKIPLKP